MQKPIIMAALTFQCVLCCVLVSVAVVSARPSPEFVTKEDLPSSDDAFVNGFSLKKILKRGNIDN